MNAVACIPLLRRSARSPSSAPTMGSTTSRTPLASRASRPSCSFFWGLDAITEKKTRSPLLNLAGNPTSGMPTMLAGLPGDEGLAPR